MIQSWNYESDLEIVGKLSHHIHPSGVQTQTSLREVAHMKKTHRVEGPCARVVQIRRTKWLKTAGFAEWQRSQNKEQDENNVLEEIKRRNTQSLTVYNFVEIL